MATKKRKAKAPKRHMVVVDRDTIYFPSQGDPEGQVHVIRKWGEAQMMSSLLLAAIARSGIPFDVLDLKGTAMSIKEHVERDPNISGVRTYPGDTMIAAALETMATTRAYLETLNAPPQHEAREVAVH